MSTSEENWIKKFIDTSLVKWIVSEEAFAGEVLESVLKNSFSEVSYVLQSQFLKNTNAENYLQ